MRLNYKAFVVIDSLTWIGLIIALMAIEVLKLNSVLWQIVVLLSIALIVLEHVYLLIMYVKNRKRIERLKEQYIETMKPTQPLRFCPNDEELVKTYYEEKKLTSQDTDEIINRNNQEKTQEEEIEMENA